MFKNPFSFKGRIRRTEFGITYIFYFMIALVMNVFIQYSEDAILFLSFIIFPLIWVMFAQAAKRCHDRGNSGWYIFIPLYIFWMLFADSDPGMNRYGPNPKGVEDQV